MDIGKLFGHAWGLFRKDIGPLIVTTVVAALAAGIPFAIVVAAVVAGGAGGDWTVNEDGSISGAADFNVGMFVFGMLLATAIVIFVTIPLYGSMVGILVRRVREGRVAEYGDVFAGFRQYGQIVSTYLLIGIIVVLLSIVIIGIPFAIYFAVLWTYAIVIVVDRRVGFGEATGASKQLVKGTGWWMTFLALFVGGIVFGIISSVLGFIPVIGAIVSLLVTPLFFAYVVAMYFQATGEVQLVDNAVAGLPPAPAGAGPYTAPAPPAPPAGGVYAPPAPPPAAPEQQTAGAPAAGPDVWTAAADPLAGQPPVAPPLVPAAVVPPAAPAPPPAPEPPAAAPSAGVSAPPAQPGTQAAPAQPGVDAGSGKLVHHCSQCGAVIEGSSEFCQVCAHEVSGGETPTA